MKSLELTGIEDREFCLNCQFHITAKPIVTQDDDVVDAIFEEKPYPTVIDYRFDSSIRTGEHSRICESRECEKSARGVENDGWYMSQISEEIELSHQDYIEFFNQARRAVLGLPPLPETSESS